MVIKREGCSLELFLDGQRVCTDPVRPADSPINTHTLAIGRAASTGSVLLALHELRVWRQALDASVLARFVLPFECCSLLKLSVRGAYVFGLASGGCASRYCPRTRI